MKKLIIALLMMAAMPACAQRIDKPGEPYEYFIQIEPIGEMSGKFKAKIDMLDGKGRKYVVDENGKKLELLDEFNDWVVVGKGVVKDGVFEIHPEVTAPTHVYLYEHNGYQLKDFILEPGTIFVKVDATDEYDYETGAKVS